MNDRPPPTAEGRLIADAATRRNISARKAAAQAGMSDARFRHLVNGYQPVGQGQYVPVVAPATTLARMALAVGVNARQLLEAGRADAAAELDKLNKPEAAPAEDPGATDDLDYEITMIQRSSLPQGAKRAMIRELHRVRNRQLADQRELQQRQREELQAEAQRMIELAESLQREHVAEARNNH